ncbi:MAG: hypothetical protein WB562_06855, partial [Candidatus Sulfotelmatobacter sp.]
FGKLRAGSHAAEVRRVSDDAPQENEFNLSHYPPLGLVDLVQKKGAACGPRLFLKLYLIYLL